MDSAIQDYRDFYARFITASSGSSSERLVVAFASIAGVGELLSAGGKSVDALLAWVRAMDKRVALMTSVCTSAAILARSGVLDGYPATTNHAAFGWVTAFGPKVLWDNVCRVFFRPAVLVIARTPRGGSRWRHKAAWGKSQAARGRVRWGGEGRSGAAEQPRIPPARVGNSVGREQNTGQGCEGGNVSAALVRVRARNRKAL